MMISMSRSVARPIAVAIFKSPRVMAKSNANRRVFSSGTTETKKSWWTSAELWGTLGAIAGWGMVRFESECVRKTGD